MTHQQLIDKPLKPCIPHFEWLWPWVINPSELSAWFMKAESCCQEIPRFSAGLELTAQQTPVWLWIKTLYIPPDSSNISNLSSILPMGKKGVRSPVCFILTHGDVPSGSVMQSLLLQTARAPWFFLGLSHFHPFPSISIHFHSFPFISIHFHSFPFISIHFHSFPFISIHFHSFPFISIHFHSFPFISIHFHSFPFISIHFHSFPFISIHFHSFPFISIHFHSFPFISIHFHSFPFISIHFHSFPFISIHFHSFPFISIHFHSFPFHSFPSISIHFHSFPFISIHFHSFPFISIHFHSFPFISIHFHFPSMFLRVSHIFVAGKANFSNGSFSPHVIRWDFLVAKICQGLLCGNKKRNGRAPRRAPRLWVKGWSMVYLLVI